MFSNKTLIQLFEPVFAIKLIFIFLLCSLVPLGEIMLLIYISRYIGIFLALALAALTGLFGVLVGYRQVMKASRAIKGKVREGEYPREEFAQFAGACICSFLLISPGFITDFFGILSLLPKVRNNFGGIITNRNEKRLKEVYEYLKLYQT